jgi:DNA-directed RNA polymerase alpha subunit
MDELVFPKEIKVVELTETSGKVVLEPLEPGFGTT